MTNILTRIAGFVMLFVGLSCFFGMLVYWFTKEAIYTLEYCFLQSFMWTGLIMITVVLVIVGLHFLFDDD